MLQILLKASVIFDLQLTFEAVLDGTGYSDIAIDDIYIDPGLCGELMNWLCAHFMKGYVVCSA